MAAARNSPSSVGDGADAVGPNGPRGDERLKDQRLFGGGETEFLFLESV
jgi:hypothetical protein